jgi:hypothetical protein
MLRLLTQEEARMKQQIQEQDSQDYKKVCSKKEEIETKLKRRMQIMLGRVGKGKRNDDDAEDGVEHSSSDDESDTTESDESNATSDDEDDAFFFRTKTLSKGSNNNNNEIKKNSDKNKKDPKHTERKAKPKSKKLTKKQQQEEDLLKMRSFESAHKIRTGVVEGGRWKNHHEISQLPSRFIEVQRCRGKQRTIPQGDVEVTYETRY